MPHPLEGIDERFKRANENILNLDAEINRFLSEKGNREIVERDAKRIEEFKEFWKKQAIPSRFSVLVSEILHHYRSALDNLIWELLRQAGHTPARPSAIEFPIFTTRPGDANKLALFNRKIEGVGNTAQAIIESLQPYNAVSQWHGPHHALLVLHDMNRLDKHRELTVIGSMSRQTPEANLLMVSRVHKDPTTGYTTRTPVAYREMYVGMKLTALVSFRQFGDNGPPNVSVIPGIRRIETATAEAIKSFDSFFPFR